ncbi:hypothetical protein CRUP_033468 [Coryphaenoides rupestris]|nr:hypothetical protein CRUP_033468 [Coryphaenoides rupestris]
MATLLVLVVNVLYEPPPRRMPQSAIHQKLELDGTEKVEGSMTQRLENRFKFLFNLPLNIERNIHKGDYDVVINDYEKAKSLYLSDLHAPGDPAWQCIYAQHKWILQLLQNCRDEFINGQRVGVGAMGALDLDGESRASALRRSHAASLKRGGSLRTPRPTTWQFETPQQVQFVEKLSDVVIGQLPNFWKLWISYVNGSLFSERMIEELTHRWWVWCAAAPPPPPPPSCPATLPPADRERYGGWEDKAELSGRWVTQVIHTVRGCHDALATLEIPNDLLQLIQDLLLDLRVHCLLVSLQQTTEDVKRLTEREDWVVDNEGVTSLPGQFEQCVVQMLQSLKEPMATKAGEVNVLQVELAQDRAAELCVVIMKAFISGLGQLSMKTGSQCSHVCADLASPNMSSGTQDDFSPTQASREAVRDLDQTLFDAYIQRKSDPIVGSLEPGIYAGYFDWRDCQPPTGVRNYLKEALVSIITVHAEARLELCALRDAVSSYLTADSQSQEDLLNSFRSSMQLQLTCFQPSCVQPVKR